MAALPDLKQLQLNWIDDPAKLAELAPLTGLRSLRLGNVFRLTDLASLTFLTAPVSLTFSTCQAPHDLRLRSLHTVPDLSPLADLGELQTLVVAGTGALDLRPLAGRVGLKVWVEGNLEPVGCRVAGIGQQRPAGLGPSTCRSTTGSRFGLVIDHISVTTEAGSFDGIAAGPEDGRPVMLLHGFPEAAVEWEHQVATLGVLGFRAVAPDQRGYSPGVRPEQAVDYRIDHLVGDVVAIADQLGWGKFDLVGHDWGGAVAWWTADAHPERLRSLAVVSTPHPAALSEAMKNDEDQYLRTQYMTEWRQTRVTERRMLENDGRALRDMFERRISPSKVDEYIQRLSEPGALTAALNWYRAGRPGGKIGKIDLPTLYIWSTEDVSFGSTAALDTGNWVTGPYRFEMLEDVTHWVPEEAPESVTTLLVEHLNAR